MSLDDPSHNMTSCRRCLGHTVWVCLRVLCLGVCAISIAGGAKAQGLTYDGASRLYTLSYSDDAGRPRSIQLEPPNRIEPRVSLVLTASGGLPRYGYTVENVPGPLTTQPIRTIEFPCDGAASAPRPVTPAGWRGVSGVSDRVHRRVCTFTVSDVQAVIAPGAKSGTLSIVSDMQPGIVDAAFWGVNSPPETLPGVDDMDVEVALLLGKAIGASGGFYVAKIVAPIRTVASLVTNLGSGLGLIQDDLAAACSLNWVTSASCAPLRELLSQSLTQLGERDRVAAKASLVTFLQQLDTEKARAGLTDQAYVLLAANARVIASRL